MKTQVCDICHKVEAYCQYKIRKRWKLLKFNYDSQGGYDYSMDICDKCFEYIIEQRRGILNEPTNTKRMAQAD